MIYLYTKTPAWPSSLYTAIVNAGLPQPTNISDSKEVLNNIKIEFESPLSVGGKASLDSLVTVHSGEKKSWKDPIYSPTVAQYRRAEQQVIQAASKINFDASDFQDNFFSNTLGNIALLKTGVYKVSYTGTFRTNGVSRKTVTMFVNKNNAEVIPSRTSSYIRNNSDNTCSCSASFFVSILNGDVLNIMAESSQEVFSIENGTWVSIEYIRSA